MGTFNGVFRAYLAGPDVFLPNPKEHAQRLKEVCGRLGIEGVFPLDVELSQDELALPTKIFHANLGLIRSCHGVLANMTPFRGPSADVGTAWEMGFAYALGLPIVGYTSYTSDYLDRVDVCRRNGPAPYLDPDFVESFGLVDNLMLGCSAKAIHSTLEQAAEFLHLYLSSPS